MKAHTSDCRESSISPSLLLYLSVDPDPYGDLYLLLGSEQRSSCCITAINFAMVMWAAPVHMRQQNIVKVQPIKTRSHFIWT